MENAPARAAAHSGAKLDKTLAAAGAAALVALIAALKLRNVVSFWYQPCFQVYSLLAGAYVLSRAALAASYREPADTGHQPSASIVVAVKNEEKNIARTVRGLFELQYPASLYDVIVVDDGSTDSTWERLEELARQYPQLVLARFLENRGKRHAMALGARRSKAEVLVYVDSDSFVEPGALRKLLHPFADPKVGAVAGHTRVLIDHQSFISKMEAVRYYVAQRILKAAESVHHSVTCCPGPFSAYRRDAVMRILDAWEHQTFLGAKATFGDDRSLTNFLLRDYRVLYHAGAVCWTFTPETWQQFFRQQLRWKKSFVRETTIAARHMWRRHPAAVASYYLSLLVTVCSPLIAARVLLALPTVMGTMAFVPYILGLMLMYLLFGLLYRYYTRGPYWYYGVAFAVLYIFVLSFQNFYAVLTVRKNHWGTR